MKSRIPKPWRYKSCDVVPIESKAWRKDGVQWFANCNAISLLAGSKAQMRAMISEQLQSDAIMGSH